MNRTTANYNRLMLDALKAIDGDISLADEILREIFAALSGPAVEWPTDDEVRIHLLANPVYGAGRMGARRPAMILRSVENEVAKQAERSTTSGHGSATGRARASSNLGRQLARRVSTARDYGEAHGGSGGPRPSNRKPHARIQAHEPNTLEQSLVRKTGNPSRPQHRADYAQVSRSGCLGRKEHLRPGKTPLSKRSSDLWPGATSQPRLRPVEA